MRAVIRGFLEEAQVLFNGDKGANDQLEEQDKEIRKKKAEVDTLLNSFNRFKRKWREKARFERLTREIEALEQVSNKLIVTLVHPGEDGNVEVMKPLRLGSGQDKGHKAKSQTFFDAGLFKKVALGEFGIRAAITDTDEANPFAVFFRRVLSGVFNAAVKSPIAGIGNVLVSNAASELSSDIGGAIKGKGGEKTAVVGVSPLAKFEVQGNGTLRLINPKDGPRYTQQGLLTLPLRFPGIVETDYGYEKRGAPNGEVVIRLEAEPIP